MTQTPEVAPVYVSVVHEIPEDLHEAMRAFVGSHPSWDQYRILQVALAGFLFQQGSRERAVARHYLDGLFDRADVGPPPGTVGSKGPHRSPAPGPEVGAPVEAAQDGVVLAPPPGTSAGHALGAPRGDHSGVDDGRSGRLPQRMEPTLAPSPHPAARVAMPAPTPQGRSATSAPLPHRMGEGHPTGRAR